jgi:hypothetical protein
VSAAPDVDDQLFWQDRISADETLFWYARASQPIGPGLRLLTYLMFGYGAYLSFKAIFIYSSADQFCDAFNQGRCSIFFYFAWPILIFSLVMCTLAALNPVMLRKGWSIRRYAITDRAAYVSAVGLLRVNRSAQLTPQSPVKMMGGTLKISNKMAFSGLTDLQFESAIAAVNKAQGKVT